MAYDKSKIQGASGLLGDKRAINADWRFVGQELTIAQISPDLKTRLRANILGYGLAAAATPKTIWAEIYDTVATGNSLGY
ncbi:hypothetical protein [Flavobacterium chilense]|uniref:Uncharacterized protein n=1 Tax=Flavobacterium chilense TaxID=946677 RepID=A0A1M7ITU0_9FLAO|nr:hypothetical protein [Flavobacterium chilense]SHM44033.1 hypothetical protein SAMN05444484_10641 [Flavobacterium chilense]